MCDSDRTSSESSDEQLDDFGDIRPYFKDAVWDTFSTLEKEAFRNQKERYEICVANSVPIAQPGFMKNHAKKAQKSSKPKSATPEPKRQSKRLKTSQLKDTFVNSKSPEEEEEEEAFPLIKPYYTPGEWAKMNILAKKHLQNAKDEYDEAVKNGLSPAVPRFMLRHQSAINASSSKSPSCTILGKDCNSLTISTSQGPSCSTTVDSNVFNSGEDFDSNNLDGSGNLEVDMNESMASEIKAILLSTLPNCKSDLLTNLASSLGKQCDTISDLNYVTEQMLGGYKLLPVQKAKLIQSFKNIDKENLPQLRKKQNDSTPCKLLPSAASKSTDSDLWNPVMSSQSPALNERRGSKQVTLSCTSSLATSKARKRSRHEQSANSDANDELSVDKELSCSATEDSNVFNYEDVFDSNNLDGSGDAEIDMNDSFASEIKAIVISSLPNYRLDLLNSLVSGLHKQCKTISDLKYVSAQMLEDYKLLPVQKAKLIQSFKNIDKGNLPQLRKKQNDSTPSKLLLSAASKSTDSDLWNPVMSSQSPALNERRGSKQVTLSCTSSLATSKARKRSRHEQSANSDANDELSVDKELSCSTTEDSNVFNNEESLFILPDEAGEMEIDTTEPLTLDIRSTLISTLPRARLDILSVVAQDLAQQCDSITDLRFVTISMLDNYDLMPLQKEKLLNTFKKVKENVKSAKPRLQAPSCNVIHSRPELSTKQLPTGVLNYSIEWGKHRDSLLRSLENKEVPSKKDREEMINIICKDLVDRYEVFREENPLVTQITPGRSYYRKIVDALWVDYSPCFEDKFRGQVINDGKFSVLDQFETCVENIYRNRNARQRGQRQSSVLRGRKKAAACGVLPEKYNPTLSKAEKKQAEILRLDLIKIYKENKRSWDWEVIRDKMRKSFGAQRNALTAKRRNMYDLVEWWPFLFEPSGLLGHMQELTGRDIIPTLQAFLATQADLVIQYLTIQSLKRMQNIKLQREASAHGDVGKLFALLRMLANHFNEDIHSIVRVIEATTLPHEVLDVDPTIPSTPCLLALGTSPFTATKFYLCAEQVVISTSISNMQDAVASLCASYFVFGVLYPSTGSALLTFIERIMVELRDESGALKASTNSGAVARSAVTKVKSLLEDLEKFESELNGTD